MSRVNVLEKQQPLRVTYKTDPSAAMVTDHARTVPHDVLDPFHCAVEPMGGCGVTVPMGVHQALGGPHDAPTPGDLLCAALAACQESTLRMVANVLGIELESIRVEVSGKVDVRGTLAMDLSVPVGFQAMDVHVHMRARPETRPELLEKLRVSAERSCVVLQTLRNSTSVNVTFSSASGDS